MTQPHHHVFNVLESQIQQKVDILPLLPFLLEKGVISEKDAPMFKDKKNGMKILTGYLRSKDYNTFVKFVLCIYEANETSTHTIDTSLVKSIKEVVLDFDSRKETNYAIEINELIEKFTKEAVEHKEITDQGLEEPVRTEDKDSHTLELPDLPYVNDPESFTFSHENGGSYYNYELDMKIDAPPGIVKDGDVKFKVGFCAYGPFAIPQEYHVVTGFMCVCTDSKLDKPVRIQMQHCLQLPSYEKTESVIILRADHLHVTNGQYVFEPLCEFVENRENQQRKKQHVRPHISAEKSHLWFELDELCILCGVLKTNKTSANKQTPSTHVHDTHQDTHHSEQELTVPQTPSVGEVGKERTGSLASSTSVESAPHVALATPGSEMQEKTVVATSPRRSAVKRRYSSSSMSGFSEENKRPCRVEYAVLMTEPTNVSTHYTVHIFVCQYCLISTQVCFKQAKALYDSQEFKYELLQGVFLQSEICIEEQIITSGWRVVPKKTPIVRETDVHLQQRSYSPLDLKKLIESNEYPPRLDFDVIATDHPQTLVCRLIIKGFSCSEYYKKESFFNITAKVPNVLDTTFNSHSRTRTNEQRNSLMNHHLSRLTDEQKQATFIYDHILKIYQHIKDWKKIGHHLGLPESLIHSIQYSNPNPGRCELSFDVLNAWVRETTAQERTYQIFIQRLIEADEMAAVQSLVNYITE